MNENIYLALDFPTWQETKAFIDRNDFHGVPVKVGMELFYREGPHLIDALKQRGHDVLLDLKLHDIPTTVMKAMRNIATLGADMVTVHALGGSDMIQRAKEGLTAGTPAGCETKLIAVTILTSMDEMIVNRELKMNGDLQQNALHFADMAHQNGADGVVCSVYEAGKIKHLCSPSCLTVTPGIRLHHAAAADQKRIATPALARNNGADILVVGRTVTHAGNPITAFENVRKEWAHGIKS
ncbi:orotidine-5'-phosphate decarboxylase [Lentibacillus salinarum]|uniref:Orotidine 5'-phosphate decarboxylase n=1 Tax=Lentibacillus salinarum TaxID=446820 RepID=A0ABW3ZQK3_9BACI